MLNFRFRGDELDLNLTFSILFKTFSILIKNEFISSNIKYTVVLYVSSASWYLPFFAWFFNIPVTLLKKKIKNCILKISTIYYRRKSIIFGFIIKIVISIF